MGFLLCPFNKQVFEYLLDVMEPPNNEIVGTANFPLFEGFLY